MNKLKLFKKPSRPDNGIKITDIALKTTKKDNIAVSIALSLPVVIILTLGAIFTFTSMFYLRFNAVPVIAAGILFPLIFVVSFKFPKSIKAVVPVFIFILGITALVIWDYIYKGVDLIYNDIINTINVNMYWTLPAQQYVWMLDYKFYTTLVIIIALALTAFFISIFFVYKPSFLGVFAFTFPYFIAGAWCAAVPSYLAFALLLAGWTATFAISRAGVKNKRPKHKSDFVKIGKKYISLKSNGATISLGVGITTTILTLLILGLATFGVTSGGFARSARTDLLRNTILDSRDKLIEAFTKKFTSDKGSALLDGRLSELGDRIVKNIPYLKVTAPKTNQPQYIKGFVGVTYTGAAWLKGENTSYSQMFENFKSANLYPQNFTGALLASLAATDGNLGSTYKTVTINSLQSNKDYAYMFYNAYTPEGFGYSDDTLVIPSNSSTYSYGAFFYPDINSKLSKSPLKKDASFKQLWEQYKDYVYKEYTKLPENGLKNFKMLYVPDSDEKYDIYEYGDKIHKMLEKDTYYDTDVDKVGLREDFVENFLFKQKKGYCVHYATAATLMFRAAGIPARYVEGYILNDQSYNNSKKLSDGNYEVYVTDANAHAWVEIFDDKYGWVKYEATPGFYTMPEDEPEDIEIPKDLLDGVPVEMDEDTQNDNKEDEKNTKRENGSLNFDDTYVAVIDFVKTFGKTAIVFAIVFAFAGLLALRRYGAIRRREKIFSGDDYKKAVLEAYSYFNNLLFYELIQNENNTPYLKYARHAAETSKHLDSEQTQRCMDIFLKAAFSPYDVTKEEAELTAAFTQQYAKDLYAAAKPLDRWIIGTIRNLY